MPTRAPAYRDMAAEVSCAACGATGVVDERFEVIPDGWRLDIDRRVYCPGCIRAYVRPEIEARTGADRDRGRWS